VDFKIVQNTERTTA